MIFPSERIRSDVASSFPIARHNLESSEKVRCHSPLTGLARARNRHHTNAKRKRFQQNNSRSNDKEGG